MSEKRVHTPHDQLTYRIVGCAMSLHRERGPRYREDTYQRDLEAHFSEVELDYQAQQLLEVYDSVQSNMLVGYYIPDFIVAECVVVEIKALSGLDNAHIAQLVGYSRSRSVLWVYCSTLEHEAFNGGAYFLLPRSPITTSIVSGSGFQTA